jgi:HD-like signal output (HDOD) protein
MLDNLLDELQPLVGDKILQKWAFPAELAAVPKSCVDFLRTPEQVDYADLVMVALLQSYAGTDHHYTEMDYALIPAFERVGVNPDPEHEDEDLSAQMEAAMMMLAV